MLDEVSLEIRENEFFTLLGPSGCGKPTLLRLIAGFEAPTSGQLLLYGNDISNEPPYRRPVNTVFQSYALFPHLTVAQDIVFGLKMFDRPKAEISATVNEMLAMVRMETMAHHKTSEISGGQQKRVALARALAPRSKVLLLDEPLSALYLKLRKEMQRELKRLQIETWITFVFVTHDQKEALTMSDRIAVMSSGKPLQVGTPREIYDRPANRFVAGFIGESNFLTAAITSAVADTARVLIGGRLDMEAVLPADGPRSGKVTVAIRPEQVRLVDETETNAIPVTVTDTVYFGTDTHTHLLLDDGETVVAQFQKTLAHSEEFANGTRVGVQFWEGSVQVLREMP
ncbi:ABC transporter ATP-binding protein [Breoghania sp.]|uniref:ABC transporter ATP-binding protein n=1 Tax=Breoghania sp. TaxID=2065378 RepID=UPI0026163D0C|nr:ABC transporter ATP-binding protein [Breoghania sp.]MDJ0931492.1 ABC transporter ATP-binding protein [Breoghania sp.]